MKRGRLSYAQYRSRVLGGGDMRSSGARTGRRGGRPTMERDRLLVWSRLLLLRSDHLSVAWAAVSMFRNARRISATVLVPPRRASPRRFRIGFLTLRRSNRRLYRCLGCPVRVCFAFQSVYHVVPYVALLSSN